MLSLNCPVYVPQFSEEYHCYTNSNAVVLPSVTRILSPISMLEYARVDRDVLNAAAELGRAVHECIEYLIDDDIDEDSLVAEWVPYLEAWKSWRATFNPRFISRDAIYMPEQLTVFVRSTVNTQSSTGKQPIRS